MELHPGPKIRRMLEAPPAKLDPILRALNEDEDWYREIIEHSQDLLCVHDLEGRFLSVNPAPARLLGYSVEEILRVPMRELVAPDYRNEFDEYLKQIRHKGEARGCIVVMTRSGERRVWEYSNTLRLEGLTTPIVCGMARDVTEQKRTEKLLREMTENLLQKVKENDRTIGDLRLFRTLLDQSNDAIEVVNPETLRFLDVNERACSELGYSREELLGMRVPDIDPTITDESIATTTKRLRESGSMVIESLHRRKDGTSFPVEVSIKLVRLERDYSVLISRNLTERKLAESLLQASESQYRAVHDRSPVGICWVETAGGRFLKVNPKYCDITGRTEEDLLSRDVQSITHADDVAKSRQALLQLSEGKARHLAMKKRYLRPDGSIRWAEVEVVAMGPENELPVWCMAIVQDITEQREAEEALRTSARQQSEIAKQLEIERTRFIEAQAVAKVGSWEVELPSLELTWSEQTHRIFETNAANFHARRSTFLALVHPEDRAKVDAAFEASLQKRGISTVEYRIVMADGRVKFLEEHWKAFHDEQGRPVRLMGTSRDVTELKQGEEALQKVTEFSENLIRTANVIILRLDTEGNVVLLNHAAEEITGYTFSELKGTNWSILVPKERFPHAWKEFDRLMAGTADETYENPLITKTGEERYIIWRNNQVIVDGAVVGTISFGIDATESRRAQEKLRRREEEYRLFVSQSSEGIFREDLDTPVPIDLPEDELIRHILYDHSMGECNDSLARMYGLQSSKELVGRRMAEMLVADDPCNVELTREFIRSGFRLIDRKSHEVDIRGNPKVFLNSMIGTVENGMLVRTWGIQRDITEQVRLEKARNEAEESLRQNVVLLQQVTDELRRAKEKLSEEKLYLEETIDTELGFGEIIGQSKGLKEVLKKVAKVAPSDATVLLLGETGTGKELVARAVHRFSKRQGNSFIKLNCAAIPSGLLESELFGHEKGAFTGAVGRKLGRLELADNGTLFLDEIGEIPLSLQPKLLRVLQDQEFERLGGTQTLKVNFRLLAATNRDLLQSVTKREFRSDLFYRLNVFPIVIPPLRERREDIRPLIEHFVRKFAAQMKKSITSIPSKTMEMLVRWEWPGNIRELENFVERSVILTPGSVLQAPLAELELDLERANSGSKDSLFEKERDRIIRVLRECHGKLGGADGAAARLGLKRTTLQSKLDKWGIMPAKYRA